jgi:lysophospholipase L1-like esterase
VSERIVVAALGDSITAGSPLWDPDPAVRKTIANPSAKSQYEHWATLAEPWFAFRNCGIYGQRTDEIARRLDSSAEGAQILIVQGGINDIAQDRPVEDAADNLRAMLRRGRELGLAVLLADVLPWNNGYPSADAAIRHLNELIHDIARDEEAPLLPFHDTLEDPEQPGRMREDWTADGDHPSVEGYRVLGELVARKIGDARSFRTASSSSS